MTGMLPTAIKQRGLSRIKRGLWRGLFWRYRFGSSDGYRKREKKKKRKKTFTNPNITLENLLYL